MLDRHIAKSKKLNTPNKHNKVLADFQELYKLYETNLQS
ncbi:MAG: Transposase [Candidatus Midichloria mitochondrii]|uniref:Uncharacterized protein n=1 Tax=Midichloria mitochondrii (strain IricVA) TaxID=696127 RepID=F7XV48_MIDMI|nr:hypothetical protein midi_00230 [Candidatus Midichloria mitochondrii IricVA]